MTGTRAFALNNAGNAAVALSVGTNGASTTYAGLLSGLGSLTKLGTGTLTLSGVNTYAGSTTVTAGTLAVSADANLGTAPLNLTPAALTLNGGTFAATASYTLAANRGITLTAASNLGVDAGMTLTYGGAVSGAFGLTKVGAGSLVLAGPNAIAGDLIVAEGNVTLASAANAPTLVPAVGGNLVLGTGAANVSVTMGSNWGNNTRGPQLDPTKVVTFTGGAFAAVLNLSGSTQTVRGLVATADNDGASSRTTSRAAPPSTRCSTSRRRPATTSSSTATCVRVTRPRCT